MKNLQIKHDKLNLSIWASLSFLTFPVSDLLLIFETLTFIKTDRYWRMTQTKCRMCLCFHVAIFSCTKSVFAKYDNQLLKFPLLCIHDNKFLQLLISLKVKEQQSELDKHILELCQVLFTVWSMLFSHILKIYILVAMRQGFSQTVVLEPFGTT